MPIPILTPTSILRRKSACNVNYPGDLHHRVTSCRVLYPYTIPVIAPEPGLLPAKPIMKRVDFKGDFAHDMFQNCPRSSSMSGLTPSFAHSSALPGTNFYSSDKLLINAGNLINSTSMNLHHWLWHWNVTEQLSIGNRKTGMGVGSRGHPPSSLSG